MRATVEDIAKLSGYSRGTVDRALKNRSDININTKKKILEIAKQLNYRPDVLAAGLASGRTYTIGLITLNLQNSYIAEMSSYIEQIARQQNYFTLITNTNGDQDAEIECLNHLLDRRVDGIILLSIHTTPHYEHWLQELNIPIVSVSNRISPNIPFVGTNDRAAAYAAVNYIYNKGYKEIIFVCPILRKAKKENIDAQEQRYFGFLDFFNEHNNEGLHSRIIGTKDLDAALDMVKKSKTKPAFLCSADVFALELYRLFTENGINVPQDAGIMGFDNIEPLKYITPKFTTIDQKVFDISKTAVERLISMIEKQPIQTYTEIPSSIVEGNTL